MSRALLKSAAFREPSHQHGTTDSGATQGQQNRKDGEDGEDGEHYTEDNEHAPDVDLRGHQIRSFVVRIVDCLGSLEPGLRRRAHVFSFARIPGGAGSTLVALGGWRNGVGYRCRLYELYWGRHLG